MKLLFDENLSYRILKKLDVAYNGSENIRGKADLVIWEYAKKNGFTVVTFDEDFYDIQLLRKFPPKVIWLRCGNTSTNHIAEILNKKTEKLKRFIEDSEQGIFEIY
jgi:predicted nuclease of predicted toxin-antitoxin system